MNPLNIRQIKDKRGFVLVLVLLIVALLMAMVVDFAYGIYVDMNGLNNLRVLEKLALQCSSLIDSSAGLLSQGISAGVITPGAPEMEVPIDDDVKVYFRLDDENSKFNLNSLVGTDGKFTEIDDYYYKSFQRLLKILGLEVGIADKVIDWIDTDSIQRPLGNEKGAKNAWLESVSELKLFIDPASYAKLEPYVTAYSSDWRVNINTAGIPVLMSLSDKIDESMAEKIVTRRERQKFKEIGELSSVPGGFEGMSLELASYITITSSAFSMHARAEEGGIKKLIDAVTVNNKIVYWRES